VGNTKTVALAHCPDLAIDVTCELSSTNAKSLAKYEADCLAFSADVESLFQDRTKLLETGRTLTLETVKRIGGELADRKREIEERLKMLRWRRFDLSQAILPDVRAAVDRAAANYEATFAAEKKRYASVGVTYMAMLGGEVNREAGEDKLRKRIIDELPCLAAGEAKKRAVLLLREVEGRSRSAPQESQCTLRWNSTSPGAADIATLAGVA
jgi:hypothetical protein